VNSTNYWKLGAFVLGGIVLAFIGLVWLGAADWNRRARTVVTYFDESVQGLEVGSAIKFRGVSVGTVSDISIAPDLRHVRVTSQVYEDVLERLGLGAANQPGFQPPAANSGSLRVQLASSGITGVKFLLVDFFDPKRFPVPVLPFDPGPDYVPSTTSSLKSIEEAAVDVTMQLPELTMRASETLLRLANAVEDMESAIKPLVAKDGPIVGVLAQYQKTGVEFERAAKLLGDEIKGARIAETTQKLRDASVSVTGFATDAGAAADDARDSMASLQETLDSIRALTDYLERDPSALLRGRTATPVKSKP
jgi:paraquat-inducible protein B